MRRSRQLVFATICTGLITGLVAPDVAAAPPTSPRVTANPRFVTANGSATSLLTVTIRRPASALGDPVSLQIAAVPAGACGGLSAYNAFAGAAAGRLTIQYVASTAPGRCKVTAIDAATGLSGSVTIVQIPAVPAPGSSRLTLTADPASVGVSRPTRSVLRATATSSSTGAPIAGDTLLLSVAGPGCGSVATPVASTSLAGAWAGYYNSGTAAGVFCTITVRDLSGATARVTIAQVAGFGGAVNRVHVLSDRPWLPADGRSTATLTATVTDPLGLPLAGDTVEFATPPGCGLVAPRFPVTDAAGVVRATYTASTTVNPACLVTAIELGDSSSETAYLPQVPVGGTPTIVVAPPGNQLPADGSATATYVIEVRNGGATVPGDTVSLTQSPTPGAACGPMTPASVATDATGRAQFSYTASTTVGFCTITFTEAGSGQSISTLLTQTASPPRPTMVTFSAADPVLPSDRGTYLTARVCGLGGGPGPAWCPAGTPLAGTPLRFYLVGPTTYCGSLDAIYATTRADGLATVNYSAAIFHGVTNQTCQIGVQEAAGGASATAVVTATPVNVIATPRMVRAGQTSIITATAATAGGILGPGQPVTFSASGSFPDCSNAILSATSALTNAAGDASVILSPTMAGQFCTVSASWPGGSGSVVVVVTV